MTEIDKQIESFEAQKIAEWHEQYLDIQKLQDMIEKIETENNCDKNKIIGYFLLMVNENQVEEGLNRADSLNDSVKMKIEKRHRLLEITDINDIKDENDYKHFLKDYADGNI